jgi:hypothetical protein
MSAYQVPEYANLIETDRTTPIGVENIHQKLDSVEVKGGPISVDQRPLELRCSDMARPVHVDRGEPHPELGVSTMRCALLLRRKASGLTISTRRSVTAVRHVSVYSEGDLFVCVRVTKRGDRIDRIEASQSFI